MRFSWSRPPLLLGFCAAAMGNRARALCRGPASSFFFELYFRSLRQCWTQRVEEKIMEKVSDVSRLARPRLKGGGVPLRTRARACSRPPYVGQSRAQLAV